MADPIVSEEQLSGTVFELPLWGWRLDQGAGLVLVICQSQIVSEKQPYENLAFSICKLPLTWRASFEEVDWPGS